MSRGNPSQYHSLLARALNEGINTLEQPIPDAIIVEGPNIPLAIEINDEIPLASEVISTNPNPPAAQIIPQARTLLSTIRAQHVFNNIYNTPQNIPHQPSLVEITNNVEQTQIPVAPTSPAPTAPPTNLRSHSQQILERRQHNSSSTQENNTRNAIDRSNNITRNNWGNNHNKGISHRL